MESDIKAKLQELGLIKDAEVDEIHITRQSVKLSIKHGTGTVRVTIPISDLDLDTVAEESEKERIWERPGWLLREYKKHGKYTAIAKAAGLPRTDMYTMRNYAQTLGWRPFEGTQIKRWEVIANYYLELNPKKRPKLHELAEIYKLSRGVVHKYVNEAQQGIFFAKSFNYQRLQTMQLKDLDLMYFPDTGEDHRHFDLPQAKGWPNLPRGLLNDFLPRLNLEIVKLESHGNDVMFYLSHQEQPITFSAQLDQTLNLEAKNVRFAAYVQDEDGEGIGHTDEPTLVVHIEGSESQRLSGNITHVIDASSQLNYNFTDNSA